MRPKRRERGAALALAAIVAVTTGCAAGTGALYSHVTRPLDANFDQTPVHSDSATGDQSSIQYYVSINWGKSGLGDLAKKHGFTRIHYADLETLSILGIYTQRTAHIYGER